jgi:hypothetical protein
MSRFDPAEMAAVTSAHAEPVLACHRQQTHPNDCGPFAAAMIITGLTGRPVVAEELAKSLDRPRRAGPFGLLPFVRRVPRQATFPWGLVDLLREAGVPAVWRMGLSPEALIARLGEGQVIVTIVGSWRWKPWAHYMVLLAHNPGLGWGFADPASRHSSLRWMDDESFDKRWRAMGRMAVLVAPEAS